jgi:hypothetical protein
MSDGPHRSLPMKRNWKSVAERADKHSFDVADISAAMIPALAGDCRDEIRPGLIERVRGIVEEQESLLIKDDNVSARIAALRAEAGHGIGQRFIDNLAPIASKDVPKTIDLVNAMAAALAERATRGSWQVEEHYLRESTASRTNNVRGRLEQGRSALGAALDGLARQVLRIDNDRPARSIAKRDGLEEGPKLK